MAAQKKSKIFLNQKGFSIIEITLVALIVSFIVLVVYNLPGALSLIGGSHKSSLAKDITSQKIEFIRNQTFDNLANGTTSITDARLNQLPGSSGNVLIEDCPVTICKNNEKMKKVTVTVMWQEKGISKNVSVVTFVAQGGLK